MDESKEEFTFPCVKCGHELKEVEPTSKFEIICPACGFVDHI
jgi:predicted RNA-binding Zn-ribbon protein involved in translation (DUF1610 family)